MFLSNVVFGWATLELLRRRARTEREKVESPAMPATEGGH
jgi:hypothetical protein